MSLTPEHQTTPAIKLHDLYATTWTERYQSGAFRARKNHLCGLLEETSYTNTQWLDAGCGSGVFTFILASMGATTIGVDGSKEMIAQALRACTRPQTLATFQHITTVDTLPFPDNTFDGALSLSVVEYLARPQKALDELHRVLKPTANLILTAPNRNSLIRGIQHTLKFCCATNQHSSNHYLTTSSNTYTRKALEKLLAASGFRIDRIHKFSPPPLRFLDLTNTHAMWTVQATCQKKPGETL